MRVTRDGSVVTALKLCGPKFLEAKKVGVRNVVAQGPVKKNKLMLKALVRQRTYFS